MFTRREDIIRRAIQLASIAIIINALSLLFAPIYLIVLKEINMLILAFLVVSTISLILAYVLKRSIEDYSLSTANKILPIAIVLGLVGGFIVVGLIMIKIRSLLREFLTK